MTNFIHRCCGLLPRHCALAVSVFAVAALTGCSGFWELMRPQTQPASVPFLAQERVLDVIAAGDVLAVTVEGETELSGDYTVRDDGSIDLPLAGALHVADENPRQASTIITDAYRAGYLVDPKVTVEIKAGPNFFMLGEVETPGSYIWRGETRADAALVAAGGVRAGGDKQNLVLIRNGRAIDITPAADLMPGDVVYVKRMGAR